MKKRKYVVLLLAILMIAGCARKEENKTELTPGEVQYTEEKLFQVDSQQETQEISEKNLTGEILDPKEYKIEIPLDYVKYDTSNRYRTLDEEKDMQSLFCIDSETGQAYFVNQNKDWYIYRLKDGIAYLAVKVPARNIYMLDGTLYFIVEDYDMYQLNGISEGDIYAYTPADGNVTKIFSGELLNTPIKAMLPYEDGIAFSCYVYKKVFEDGTEVILPYEERSEANAAQIFWYYYTFADGTLEQDPYRRAYPGWDGYYLQASSKKTKLIDREDYQNCVLEAAGGQSFLIEGTLYTFNKSSVVLTELETKQQEVIDIRKIMEELLPNYLKTDDERIEWLTDLVVTENGMCGLIAGQFLLKIDAETKDAAFYMFSANKVKEKTEDEDAPVSMLDRIYRIYTDGKDIYAKYSDSGEKDSAVLVKIDWEQRMGYHNYFELPIIKAEYLTE